MFRTVGEILAGFTTSCAINHMKLVMKMHLTEYTFYSVQESGTYRNIPPVIISVCEDRIKPEYQLIFHDKDTSLVKKALSTLVDWTKTNIVFPLPVCQKSVLSDIASVNGATITTDIRFHHFVMRNRDGLPALKIEDDICVRSLTTDDAPIINSHWNYRDEDSEVIIRRNIEMCPGYGVYCADRLVSWMVLRGHGSMSYLHTIPEARRRGYSLAVVNKLSRHIRSIGLTPIADVIEGNVPSENLFYNKLGFQQAVATTRLLITPIRKYQYFRMTSANPGVVFVKTDRDADEINIQGIRAGVHFNRDELPEVIEPRGLSQQRQAYFFNLSSSFCEVC